MDALATSPPGRHLTVNTLVHPDGGSRAEARSDVAFLRPNDGGGWSTMVVGSYQDVVVHDDTWRFERRVISLS
jgi:hypothetical protein